MNNVQPKLNKALSIYGIARDTVKLSKDELSTSEYVTKTAKNLARFSASTAGATGGAAIGTMICPGIGTAIGTTVGIITTGALSDSI